MPLNSLEADVSNQAQTRCWDPRDLWAEGSAEQANRELKL